MFEGNELKLYTQLYQESIPKGNEGLGKLKEKVKIYDINPNLNYRVMKKILEKKSLKKDDIKTFCDFYRDHIQTLFYEQKLDIIKNIKENPNKEIKNNIKFKLNEKSFIDSYFDIIAVLCKTSAKLNLKEKINYDKILELFHYDYYVDNFGINTPLIYGTYELIFAGLINNLYHHFFVDKKEDINTENIDTVTGWAEYPKKILKKIEHKKSKKKNDNDKSGNKKMDIDDELSPTKIDIDTGNFDNKIYFLNSFFIKILSNEFKEIFNLEDIKKENNANIYEAKPKVNALIFHLLFLELIFHIYNIYDSNEYLSNFDHRFFFETKEEKFGFFKLMDKIKKEVIIVDENKNEVKTSKDISNKIYTIYNARNLGEKIEINPYDYILSKFTTVTNFYDLVNKFSDVNYFSLNKFYKENRLFENVNLDTLFKEDIKEMLSTKTIYELFRQYVNFSDYICPYSGKEKENFIKQTFDITYYFPIPFKNIAGFTYKTFGLIFINNINRFEKIVKSHDNNALNKKFCQQINKLSFFKVVHIHEIIGHYSCTIIHSNNSEISIATPPNTLKDYELKNEFKSNRPKMDGGDLGESVLLGNKIKYIYTKGALYLINNNNFNKNLEKYCKDFISKNEFKNGDTFDFMMESKNSQLINEFIKHFFNGENSQNSIRLSKENFTGFRIIEPDEKDKNLEDEYFDNYVTCFENATHIFPHYGRIHY